MSIVSDWLYVQVWYTPESKAPNNVAIEIETFLFNLFLNYLLGLVLSYVLYAFIYGCSL